MGKIPIIGTELSQTETQTDGSTALKHHPRDRTSSEIVAIELRAAAEGPALRVPSDSRAVAAKTPSHQANAVRVH